MIMIKKYLFFYERLSKEDGDDESSSIGNQRRLLFRFQREKDEFSDYEVEEFIDDGYTGTNFERPDFQRMMEKIRSLYGNMIVVVTKDFSRLGRDTIDTVNYLEKIFPFLEVRYIAVNEDYDSNDYPYGLDFENKFKNLINGIYPMQISYAQKKIKMEEAQQGKHNGPIPTYGYWYTKEREYEVDWEAATVVQMIMDFLEQRKSYKYIICFLAEKKIDPPSIYLTRKYGVKLSKVSRKFVWNRVTIRKIARNKTYLGYSVRHTVESCSPGSKKARAVSKEQQVLVPNRHLAIISMEQFDNVNDWLDERAEKAGNKKVKQQRISALYKKVYCKNCGSTLTRRIKGNYDAYICLDKRENPFSVCPLEPIKTSVLEAAVFDAIQFNIKSFMDNERKGKKLLKGNVTDLHEEFASLHNSAELLSRQKMELYEKYNLGHLTKEKYIEKKDCLSKQISVLEKQFAEIEENINRHHENNFICNSEYAELVGKFKGKKVLSADMADAFIKKVFVDSNHNIEFFLNFQDDIDSLFRRASGSVDCARSSATCNFCNSSRC